MKQTVKEIVIKDYRAAEVFKKWGINYCCSGNHTLDEICITQKLDKNKINVELENATKNIRISNTIDFNTWPIEFLIDYIVHIHHDYLRNNLPPLTQHIKSFTYGHRKKHPYLDDVEDAFSNLAEALMKHNQNEEENIFPYLKQINNIYNRRETYGSLFVKTLSKPLENIITKEHLKLDGLFKQLRQVTNNYQFDNSACANHQVIYHKLKELDEDMIQHKYLENDILFPRIMAIEKELLQL